MSRKCVHDVDHDQTCIPHVDLRPCDLATLQGECERQKKEDRSPHLSTLVKVKELNEFVELHSQPVTLLACD
jgi:hypothetical protein